MKGLVGFFKLVRPVNLLIIVFTMVAMRWGVLASLADDFGHGTDLQMDHWKFCLSIVIMVLLAAGGNIINDYFDLKVDRINKPEKVVIGKQVKRRVAMLTHHGFNAIAVLLGIFLAWDSGQFFIAAVPIVMGILLWFYSTHFKKQPFIGNFIVALLVAVVPIWSGVFEIPILQEAVGIHSCMHFETYAWYTLMGFAIFAFWLTLIREALKDLEDLDGDTHVGFKTLPILLGVKKTKSYLGILFFFLFCGLPILVWEINPLHGQTVQKYLFFFLLFGSMLIPSIIAYYKMLNAKKKDDYAIASLNIKIVMAVGISLGFFMWF